MRPSKMLMACAAGVMLVWAPAQAQQQPLSDDTIQLAQRQAGGGGGGGGGRGGGGPAVGPSGAGGGGTIGSGGGGGRSMGDRGGGGGRALSSGGGRGDGGQQAAGRDDGGGRGDRGPRIGGREGGERGLRAPESRSERVGRADRGHRADRNPDGRILSDRRSKDGPRLKDGPRARDGRDQRRAGRDDGRRYDRKHIHKHGRRYSWGPGITFWLYDGHYYGDCEWLRRRAIASGSRYWWRRYNQCRYW